LPCPARGFLANGPAAHTKIKEQEEKEEQVQNLQNKCVLP